MFLKKKMMLTFFKFIKSNFTFNKNEKRYSFTEGELFDFVNRCMSTKAKFDIERVELGEKIYTPTYEVVEFLNEEIKLFNEQKK
jgi:hypothetical protein